jgi:methylthioribulose-1-phosphate dehydratase
MMSLPYEHQRWRECAIALAQCGRELAALGWTPATSSNFSMRLSDLHVAITISGRDKGHLHEDDIMVVDLHGRAVGSEHRPSAETLLHTQLYARDPEIGCVLHTHSHNQTVASRLYGEAGELNLAGYELLKAFRGFDSHEALMRVPVFPNSQDMTELAGYVEDWLADGESRQLQHGTPRGTGYLIDGHGIYAWGRDMAETRRHLDAFEFLLSCELDLRRLR